MKTATLITFAVFFTMAGQAVSNGDWCDVDIVPQNPTSCDVVVITLSGEWGSSCIPNASAISVSGNDIYFDVILDYPPGIYCLDVITPWEQTRSVGPLSEGTYSVYVALDRGPWTLMTEFYVAETNTYVFVPDQSTLVKTGGFPGVHETYDIEGWFKLAVNLDANTASFDEVYGDLYYNGVPLDTTLDILLRMTEMISTSVSDTVIEFESNPLPGGIIGELTLTFEEDDSVHLTGNFSQALQYPFNYDLDAVAQKVTSIYYVDGTNGDDNNDGLTPQTAFATIQKGVDTAQDGNTVLVYPAVYNEAINFDGKAITVQGVATAAGIAVLEAPMDYAVSFYTWEEPNSVLKNFVIRDSFMAVFIAGASPTISNLTVVDNAYGIEAYAGSEPDISNSILWNNTGGDLFQCEVRYSCIEEGGQGEGNIDADPYFADPCGGDYHLKSTAGRWDPNSETWITDSVTSPCIDAGNPGCPLGDEPNDTNNVRINMGAYGGTATASKSPADWRSIADLTNDYQVDFNDLDVFVQYWLDIGECIPSDLNRSQAVDFGDYAIFAENWLYNALPILTDADIILELEYLETINTYPENLNIDPNDYPIVLGRYSENWLVLIEKYFCSDVCPDYGRVVLIYEDITSEEECAEIGGVAIIDPAWGSYIGCAPDVE